MTTLSMQTAIMINHIRLTEKMHYFVFEQDLPFIFKPGQYISVKVADGRMNSYSIVNQNNQNQFDLLIDISPGGPGSKYFESLKIDDKICYLGPFGTFTFKHDDGAQNILLLATGSGLSPLRAILDQMLKQRKLIIPITLYFGLRFQKDIFWKDYFEKLEQDYPNFKLKLVLSKPDENWHGLTGHITDYIKLDHPELKNYSAYICGNKPMINEAKTILLEAGLPKERIYFEMF